MQMATSVVGHSKKSSSTSTIWTVRRTCTPTPYRIIRAARRSPSMRTTRVGTDSAYARAPALKRPVVMKTPWFAWFPWRAPTKAWISGRPTEVSSAYRLAWT